MPANTSYISDAVNFTELWEMCEKVHIYELVTDADASLTPVANPLPADQSARLIRALNWGREQIDNLLREKYQVSSLTHATATDTLKNWNWRYAQWMLEKRRRRSGELTSEERKDIDDEILQVAQERSPHSLAGVSRGPSPIATAVDSHATQFDAAGQFNIPSREWDDIWPDGGNE